jgi:hypothetical protein
LRRRRSHRRRERRRALDLIAGPNWYAGPEFELGGTLVQNPPKLGMDQYSLFFLTFSADLNADGHVDVIGIADAGGGNGSGTPIAHWYENPGPDKLGSAWAKHPIFNQLVSNESPVFQNVAGDAANGLAPRELFRGVFIAKASSATPLPAAIPLQLGAST